MRRMTLFVLTISAVLALAGPAAAEDPAVAALRASFEGAVAALNSGNLDGFLDTVHVEALSFYSCGPTSGKQGRARSSRWADGHRETAPGTLVAALQCPSIQNIHRRAFHRNFRSTIANRPFLHVFDKAPSPGQ